MYYIVSYSEGSREVDVVCRWRLRFHKVHFRGAVMLLCMVIGGVLVDIFRVSGAGLVYSKGVNGLDRFCGLRGAR